LVLIRRTGRNWSLLGPGTKTWHGGGEGRDCESTIIFDSYEILIGRCNVKGGSSNMAQYAWFGWSTSELREKGGYLMLAVSLDHHIQTNLRDHRRDPRGLGKPLQLCCKREPQSTRSYGRPFVEESAALKSRAIGATQHSEWRGL
jgi:hypothetical protein